MLRLREKSGQDPYETARSQPFGRVFARARFRTGQAIIEALVAISVLTIGFLGIFTLLSQSFSLNRVVSDSYVGNYLASEGIEVIKNMIDANTINGRPWNSSLNDGTYEVEYNSDALESGDRFLAFDPNTDLYSYSGSQTTPYKRKITLTNISPDQLKVSSVVFWTDRGGGAFNVTLEDHFYHWRP